MSDVIVVGLGAVGAATAWQFAARGLRVVAFDARRPPHGAGSTHGGSRIIRETAFEHPRYVPIVRRAFEHWSALEARSGRALFLKAGVLYAGVPTASVVTGSRASAREHGVVCEELAGDDIARRWPMFASRAEWVGLLETGGGLLRAEACVDAMLEAATAAGAALHFDEPVVDWGAGKSVAWVRTRTARHEAAHLVFAMGPWMLPIVAPLLAGTWVERVTQHWFVPSGDAGALAPGRMSVYLWEDADGVVFYGFPMLDGAVKCAVHHRGESTTADAVRRTVGADEVEVARTLLAKFVPGAAGPHLHSAVCLYTNTPSGDMLVDRHPEHVNVILASPCNGMGFKFAPALGEAVADLIQGTKPRFDMTPFSLAGLSTSG